VQCTYCNDDKNTELQEALGDFETWECLTCGKTFDVDLKPTWSDTEKKSYVVTGGVSCPFCRSKDIEGGHIEVDAGSAWQPVTCSACGREWEDVYRLVDIEI